jgi:hypothetical protein
MSSTKKGDVKENTNRTKESTEKYLEQQKQQYKDTASDLSQATEKFNENVNKFQKDNRRIIEKNYTRNIIQHYRITKKCL